MKRVKILSLLVPSSFIFLLFFLGGGGGGEWPSFFLFDFRLFVFVCLFLHPGRNRITK